MTNRPPGSVLITGASKRIGATLARYFHGLNDQVLIHYRTEDHAATRLLDELNGLRERSAFKIQADLVTEEGIARVAAGVSQLERPLTLVIHNAALFLPTSINEATRSDWDQLFETNLKAPYFLTQALLAHVDPSASFIFICDILGEIPLRHFSAYSASKAGLAMITRSLALELAPKHRVNGIALGAILPPLIPRGDHAPQPHSDENPMDPEAHFELNEILRSVPLGRMGSPQHVAVVAGFLASNDYVTGQIIPVDGGRLTGGLA